jgi:hypothetical protein
VTLPAGPELRARIAYHLARSTELANGQARDANDQPVTDAASIERSTVWHHGQAQVLALVLLADSLGPSEVVMNMGVLTAQLGTEVVAEHAWRPGDGGGWLPDYDPADPGPHTAPASS